MSRTNTGSRKDTFFGRTARQLRQLEAAAERKESAGLSPGAPSFTKFFAGAGEVAAGISVAAQEVSRRLEPVAEWARSPEGAEVLRFVAAVVEDLRESGGDEQAAMGAFVRVRLGREPDARLLTVMRTRAGEIPVAELWAFLDHHGRRLNRDTLTARVQTVRTRIRVYESLNKARSFLADYYKEGRERILLDALEEAVCAPGAHQLSDVDLVRAVSNRIRREATDKRKEARAALLLGGSQETEDPDLEAWRMLLMLQQIADSTEAQKAPPSRQELESFAIAAYMPDGEAASILGRPKNQIKQERLRGRKKLRRASGF